MHLQRKKKQASHFGIPDDKKQTVYYEFFVIYEKKKQLWVVLVLNGNGETYSNYVHSENVH